MTDPLALAAEIELNATAPGTYPAEVNRLVAAALRLAEAIEREFGHDACCPTCGALWDVHGHTPGCEFAGYRAARQP